MGLSVSNIVKKYGEYTAVDNLTFEMNSPGVFALLGTNGAGKTTSIRIILGMLAAESGEVKWDGKPFLAAEKPIGYLAEERGLYPKIKIMDQLVYFCTLKGMRRQDALKSLDYWFERLSVAEHRNKRAEQLSKGNQQKIQLVTALAHNPDIVILDEPFSGLDPVNAMILKDVVKEEIANGKIVLFSSHQMNYIEEFCDSIAILNSGTIVLQGDIHEIKHNYVRDKLVVRSDQADAIAQSLGSCCSRTNGRELMVRLKTAEDKRKVMQQLTEAYDIDEIGVFEPSLNDIFVEYAKDQY